MSPLYKEGLYWLILLAVTALTYAVAAIFVGPIPATGTFSLLGLAGLQPLLYRKRRQAVIWDERDTLISYRALIAGYSIFWLAFTAGTMGPWGLCFFRGQQMISVEVLPLIMMGGTVVFLTARAVAIVVQYRRQDADKGA